MLVTNFTQKTSHQSGSRKNRKTFELEEWRVNESVATYNVYKVCVEINTTRNKLDRCHRLRSCIRDERNGYHYAIDRFELVNGVAK